MKKLLVLMIALTLSASLVACGGSDPAPSSSTPAPAPSSSASSSTPASSTPSSSEADEEMVYELDYAQIATWVDGGFIGVDELDSPVVMAIDAANEYAIIIFGNNDDMTAASVMGEITYDGEQATITDEVNEIALTFGIAEVSKGTIELDMGEQIGKATITATTKEEVLETIKIAIDNYKHLA